MSQAYTSQGFPKTDPTKGAELRKVWDLPTRLLKWGLAGVVIAAWLIGENLSFTNIDWHFYLGYAAGALVALRLIWGFFGSPAARHSTMLSDLLKAPRYLLTMFAPQASNWPGHNPIGVISVYAFWIVIAAQVATGLFAYSDSFFAGGPLSGNLDEAAQIQVTGLHHLLSKVLLALFALHLAALAFYRVRKGEGLIRPMITGWKWVKKD